MKKFLFCLSIGFLFGYHVGFSQVRLSSIYENKLNRYLLNNLQNKVYIQTNANRYIEGDTIWFKSTLVNAIVHLPSFNEKMIYIDLVSPEKTVVIHQVFYVFGGFSAGCLPLKNGLSPGIYTLTAYTNSMRNYSSEFFFQKNIEVIGRGKSEVEWDFNQKVTSGKGGDSVTVILFAKPENGRSLNTEANISVQLSRGHLLGGTTRVVENNGRFSFFVPDSLKLAQAMISLKLPGDCQSTSRYRIELIPEKPDLQFLPEGGWLFPGIKNRVAFKCIDGSGNPLMVDGSIFDEHNSLVTSFTSEFQGMGTVDLFPSDSSSFEAELNWKGKVFRYRLPGLNPKAYALHLEKETSDSLFFLLAKPNEKLETIGLMGHTRGEIHYFAEGETNEHFTRIAVPKSEFPGGISAFTLIARRYPMAERLVLIEHSDQLNIQISTNKDKFEKRDRVDVEITVTDQGGQPAVGSFSLHAFDRDAGLGIDHYENIQNYLLYTSELNGKTFQARQFFDRSNPDYARNLDLLMLTSGWRRFSWPDVMLDFQQEKEFKTESHMSLSGEIRRGINNKTVPKNFEVTMSLNHKNGLFVNNARTGNKGQFAMTIPDFTDSARLIIQTKNRLGWQRDYLIDLQTNLERKNVSHLNFNKVSELPVKPVITSVGSSQSAEEKQPEIKVKAKKVRKDNYYFPGKDTFLIEEVEVKSDYLSQRDSLIFQTGEPDVVIESSQLQQLTEEMPWYGSIWDLIQNQIPGLLILSAPYDQNRAERANLVIGTPDFAIYFFVAKNPEGRLLISVDGEFLGKRSVKLYDFLSNMDPNEIESINFIAKPKKYENATFDEELDIYSNGLSFSDQSSPVGITTEINDMFEASEESAVSDLFEGEGQSQIQNSTDYLKAMERMTAPPSYLYISTKSKKGIFFNRPKGIAQLYLQGLTNYREYYNPRYESPAEKSSVFPDQRVTLCWDPNIVTDSTGKARVSFYTADSEAPFDLLVQGISVGGLTGVRYQTLNEGLQQSGNEVKPMPLVSGQIYNSDKSDRNFIFGKIVDQELGIPLNLANVYQSDPYYQVSTNFEGEFLLDRIRFAQGKELKANCPGYEPVAFLADTVQHWPVLIALKKSGLHPVSREIRARDLVRDAIRKSGKMYGQDDVFSGYFRETMAINDDYYGIYESTFNYTNKGYAGEMGSLLYETERFKNMEDRNSHKLLILKPNHRSKFYPLNSDILSVTPGFLNYSFRAFFDFALVGEVEWGGTTCYKLVFDQSDDAIQPLEKGILYIEKESLAILHAEWELSPKGRKYMSYTRYLQSNPMSYQLQVVRSWNAANYMRIGDKLILQSTREQFEFSVNQNDRIKFERVLSVNGYSHKNRKLMKNSTFDSLIEEEKGKRMQVKDARYLMESWHGEGMVKPEVDLQHQAQFMHDITLYR